MSGLNEIIAGNGDAAAAWPWNDKSVMWVPLVTWNKSKFGSAGLMIQFRNSAPSIETSSGTVSGLVSI